MEGTGSPTAGVIIRSDVGIVLVKEVEWWGIPKGKVEPGEEPIDAACREVLEEVSILISPNGSHINTPLREVAESQNSKGKPFWIYETTLNIAVIPTKSHEHEEVRYFECIPENVDPRVRGLL